MSYKKSAQCSLLIKETADVVISIDTPGVAWAITGDKPASIHGASDGTPFSMSHVVFDKTTVEVRGFSIEPNSPRQGTIEWQGGGGVGPVNSGVLQIDLYLWAIDGISEVTLSINRAADVWFGFVVHDSAPDWKKVGQLRPGIGQSHGTHFDWPKSN